MCTNRARASISKYNAAYVSKKDFVSKPNAFLKQCLNRIAPKQPSRRKRRALDIGLGQGRNAILLAQHGYDVTGIDRSDVGLQAATRLAGASRVRINAVLADAEKYDFGRNRWDLIVLLYYPQPMFLIDRLKAAVRPGGHILVERFSRPDSIHRRDAEESHKPSPMLRSFLDWHVLHYENDELKSDWHWAGESSTGPMVRLLARKPLRK
jgi:SAM-dependent methyltransferase